MKSNCIWLPSFSSHPMWVRGLKHEIQLHLVTLILVAPHVGAWIETPFQHAYDSLQRSHPMWVRGLKHVVQLG